MFGAFGPPNVLNANIPLVCANENSLVKHTNYNERVYNFGEKLCMKLKRTSFI